MSTLAKSAGNMPASFRETDMGRNILSEYQLVLREMNTVNVNTPVTPTLDNIRQLYELVGKPLSETPVVHVGGTNGKGSVTFKLSQALQRSGLKTGLFVSPHISSFRERAQVNGELLSEEDVCTMVPPIIDVCREHNIAATFFDLTTILSFLKFQKVGCEVVVLEVGLGGELDSTNVLSETSISIITSVQLDHVRTLGNTVEEIAQKKAGIIKTGVPLLVGPGTPAELLRSRATARNAPFFELTDFGPSVSPTIEGSATSIDVDALNRNIAGAAIRLMREHFPNNGSKNEQLIAAQLKVATSLDHLDDTELDSALQERPPCRYQEVLVPSSTSSITSSVQQAQIPGDRPAAVKVVLDVAHNTDAIEALVRKVRATEPAATRRGGVVVVLAMSRDKPIAPAAKLLSALVHGDVSKIICVDASGTTHRALPCCNLREVVNRYGEDGTRTCSRDLPVSDAIHLAVNMASSSSACTSASATVSTPASASSAQPESGDLPLVLVCGSGFIMADARRVLGIMEPRD